jgi:hypothetical protein
MHTYPRCPGIDTPCPRAGKWLWTHRGRGEERYCLPHVTDLLAALATNVAARMEASNGQMQHGLDEQRARRQAHLGEE